MQSSGVVPEVTVESGVLVLLLVFQWSAVVLFSELVSEWSALFSARCLCDWFCVSGCGV